MVDNSETSGGRPTGFPRRELQRAARLFTPDFERPLVFHSLLRMLLIVAVVVLVVGFYLFRREIAALASEESLRQLGYVPVFIIPLLSSASLLLPLPGAAVVFLGGALLVPLFVGLVAGTGEALGELTGYAAGYGAGAVVERSRRYQVVAGWMRRHGTIVLFLLAVIPNPLFDLAGMAAGALRFPLGRFLLVVLTGKVIKDIGLALAGAWGAHGIADWLAPLVRRLME